MIFMDGIFSSGACSTPPTACTSRRSWAVWPRINSVGHVAGYGRGHTLAILLRTPAMWGGASVANRVVATVWEHPS